ncbi:MAG: hypothetical protein WBG63_05310 [Phormidesmis sp.]
MSSVGNDRDRYHSRTIDDRLIFGCRQDADKDGKVWTQQNETETVGQRWRSRIEKAP